MAISSPPSRVVRFGVFEIDLETGQLRKKGLEVKLQEQPFQVLAALLERPGEIITHKELKERIWGTGTFVDFDQSLASAIRKVREVLGDSATNPRFVETLPRRGYRFIAPVEVVPSGHEAKELRETTLRSRVWAWSFVSTALLAIVVGTVWFVSIREPVPPVPPRIVPLTSSGSESINSFSPDGSQVLLTWCDPDNRNPEGNCDLYVKPLGAEEALRLTTHPFPDIRGAWSPDGRWIAFLRRPPTGKAAYYLVSPLGGTERKLVDTYIPIPPELVGNVISWFPDANRMVVTRQDSPDDPLSLHLLSVGLDEQWRLTSPPSDSYGDSGPAVSPDGRKIIFSRTLRRWVGDLFLLELTEDLKQRGEPVRLTFDNKLSEGLVWTPDGREIIFAAGGKLWRIEVSGGQAGNPERLPFIEGQISGSPAISADGHRLAYTQKDSLMDILRVELSDPTTAAGPPTKFISSTRIDAFPEYSRDGERVAFVTNRSGLFEIWACDSDGSNLLRLVSKSGSRPNWSPDGEWIAFTSRQGGNRDVYIVPAQGGVPRRMTTQPSEDVAGSWSHDGKWIYFTSDRAGEPGTWKILAEGGDPVEVAKGPASDVFESSEEGALYYLKPVEPGRSDYHSLWKLHLEDGEETKVLDAVYWRNYTVANTGIYFISRHDLDCGCHHLQFLKFATGQIKTVIDVEGMGQGLSVSPDGRSLLYTHRTSFGFDVVLVENFR